MAEVTALRNNALPYPVYGAPWAVVFPVLDADGDLVTGAATPDSEVSKNGDTFADCTNEFVEIATASGTYYLLLTATEMTADVVAVMAKSATAGMKTTPMVFYPRKLVTIRSGTSQSGTGSTIVLDASASAKDDAYNGMICIATIDSNVEARMISDYVGSSKTATVVPDWNVTPDSDDTFIVKLPEGIQVHEADLVALLTDAQSATDLKDFADAGYDPATNKVQGLVLADTLTTYTGNTLQTGDSFARIGAAGAGLTAIDLPNQTMDIVGNITGALSGSVGSVTGAVGSVTGLTAATVHADLDDLQARLPAALTADGNIKADTLRVGGTLQTAGDLAAMITVVYDLLDTEVAAILSALVVIDDFLDTEIAAILAAVDTEVAAIKAKTDGLTFTVATVLDANIQRVNDVALIGDGGVTPWGP